MSLSKWGVAPPYRRLVTTVHWLSHKIVLIAPGRRPHAATTPTRVREAAWLCGVQSVSDNALVIGSLLQCWFCWTVAPSDRNSPFQFHCLSVWRRRPDLSALRIKWGMAPLSLSARAGPRIEYQIRSALPDSI
eukprot:sb/3474918/